MLEHPNKVFLLIETRFSSKQKVINTIAYINRFISMKTKKSTPGESLSIEELEAAEMTIVRLIQQNYFPTELKTLTKSPEAGTIPKNSSLAPLSAFVDQHGIIRVGGRLENSDLSYDQKHPIILPSYHYAMLIVREAHQKNLHPRPSALKSFILQKYWIINSRNIIRKITHDCVRY